MDWVKQVLQVRRGRSSTGARAPHKPLVLLYALGQFQRQGDEPIVYSEAEAQLKRLLAEFGLPGSSGPSYPFHHLTSDGIWLVRTAAGAGSPGRSPASLRDNRAAGWFVPALVADLSHNERLLAQLARAILDDNFEPSLHADICDEVGLDLRAVETGRHADVAARARRRRDPDFRRDVMRAYEYRCAFCGYDGWLDNGSAVGLDAAHVRWWAFSGPDSIDNGLCLCALHHKLLDKGVLGLTIQRTVAVSAAFIGRTAAAESLVLSLAGRDVRTPQRGFPFPCEDHIRWHGREVFRPPARAT